LRLGQVRTGNVKFVQVKSGLFKLGEFSSGDIRLVQVRLG